MVLPRFADRQEIDGKPVPELREFANQVMARNAAEEIDSIMGRFERSPVRIEDVDVRIVSDESK